MIIEKLGQDICRELGFRNFSRTLLNFFAVDHNAFKTKQLRNVLEKIQLLDTNSHFE